MALLNAKKQTSTFLLLAIIAGILLIAILLNNNKSVDDIIAINSDSNIFLKPLPEKIVKQIEQAEKEDSLYLYSVSFNDDPLERTLTLINKNPSQGEFINLIQVHVFPVEASKYKELPNFKKGYLNYSVKRKPVMYNYNGDNYSLLNVTLPQIDVSKIYLYQPGIYKKTFEDPIFKSVKIEPVNFLAKKQHLYIPVLHKMLNDFDIEYLPYNNEQTGGFLPLAGYQKEQSITLLKIDDSPRFWSSLTSGDLDYMRYAKINGSEEENVSALLKNITENKLKLSTLFDINKLSHYYALVNLFSNNTDRKINFIYDTSIGKLEPLFCNYSDIGVLNNYIKDEGINDSEFLIEYAQSLIEIGSINLEEIIQVTPQLKESIQSINSLNPSLLFESSLLKHNQLILLNGARPSTTIKAELLHKTDNVIQIVVSNLSDYPVVINDLNYQTKKHIASTRKESILAPNTIDTIVFELPRSFENLFVHKKTKTTGFIFEKDIFDLNVSYTIVGIGGNRQTELIPYQPIEEYNQDNDLFLAKTDLKNLDYLTINENNKTIELIKDFKLSQPLIFPEGYTIVAKPGRRIDIVEGGKIISYSPFEFVGTKDKRITIHSSDKEGQGLLVVANGKESNIKYLNFDGLTNPSHGMWSTTSAVTFYESPVNFDYVTISNNTCEDAINVVRTNFKMTNTSFKNTQSDAFDGDFVTGIINSCVFQNLGNDAIDVSGSNLDISNVKIINAGDKGLSAGEDSQMKVQGVSIDNCGIAVAGKDLSIVTLNNLTIKNTKLGFTAFQKKPEFGPSNITATNITMIGVETKYLIENTSSLLVDGVKIETEQNVIDRMYGAEFGRSSSETRERQKEQ